MTVKLSLDIVKDIRLQCDYDQAFDVFVDVPRMAAYFPEVENLTHLDGSSYKWEMEKVGISKFNIQVVYAAEYEHDREKGWIKWVPVDGVGNGRNRGDVRIERTDNGILVHFFTAMDLELPLPALTRSVAKKVVEKEWRSLADAFQKNIEKAFNNA